MKRVLHVFANLNLGGAESRIMDVYRHIDRASCQFDFLIFTEEDCYFDAEVTAMGGHIYRVTHPGVNLLKHMREVSQILKTNSFCALHSHTSYFSGLIVFLGWRHGVPRRISHARNQAVGRVGRKSQAVFRLGSTLCNLFSTSRLAISKEAGRFLFGGSSAVQVVPNSFEFDKIRFDPAGLLPSATAGELNMVMVARLSKIKNHVFAINLVSKLRQKGSKVKLHLIGSGTEEAHLVQLVASLNLEDSVIFWGRRDDVQELLCEFDCLLLPSHSEGLGVAALEGQAAGLPCLVSEGVPEDVDIGLGLVRRLPLELDQWMKAIDEMDRDRAISKDLIDKRFSTLGYTVAQTSKIYLEKYGVSQ